MRRACCWSASARPRGCLIIWPTKAKPYAAVLALGATTTTEDASGEVLTQADASHLTREELEAVLPRFVGDVQQIPPMVSAVHHEGKRLYELARAGITVERQARTIRIDALTLGDFTPGILTTATLTVECGKGTYIRTLCADLGAALRVGGGHMAALRRTRVGAFTADAAVPLDALTLDTLPGLLTSPADALGRLPSHTATEAERVDIAHGRALVSSLPAETVARVLDPDGVLIALARADGERLHPFKVFPA